MTRGECDKQCAGKNKEDISGVDLIRFFRNTLAPSRTRTLLVRDINDRSFENLEQSLLHALTRDILGMGRRG